jgi:2-keto-4-pentenoate hydratase/2-oxohepta-3-ene-1,7-dioic acid hydratase in catechol pathway
MARKRGTDKQSEVEDESLDYIMGVGSLHNVSDRPVKQKPKRQIGFIRTKEKGKHGSDIKRNR